MQAQVASMHRDAVALRKDYAKVVGDRDAWRAACEDARRPPRDPDAARLRAELTEARQELEKRGRELAVERCRAQAAVRKRDDYFEEERGAGGGGRGAASFLPSPRVARATPSPRVATSSRTPILSSRAQARRSRTTQVARGRLAAGFREARRARAAGRFDAPDVIEALRGIEGRPSARPRTWHARPHASRRIWPARARRPTPPRPN